jgi:hypothetical protein
MIDREPGAGGSLGASGTAIPQEIPERYREKVVVRRRRAGKHRHFPKWSARTARKRVLRTFAVCTGVLLLMALGLYFGLAHQEANVPADGASHATRRLIALAG